MTKPPAPLITCPWCDKRVEPNAARMRLHQSESIRFSGNVLATFHPDCGDELLDWLEERRRVADGLWRQDGAYPD